MMQTPSRRAGMGLHPNVRSYSWQQTYNVNAVSYGIRFAIRTALLLLGLYIAVFPVMVLGPWSQQLAAFA